MGIPRADRASCWVASSRAALTSYGRIPRSIRSRIRLVFAGTVAGALAVATSRAEAHDLGIPVPHLAAGHGIAFEPARRLVLFGATATAGISSESNVDAILFQASVYASSLRLESKIVAEGDFVWGTVLVGYRRYHRISRRLEWYGTFWLGGGASAQGLRGNEHVVSPTLAVSGDFGLRVASVLVVAAQGSYSAPLAAAPLGLTLQLGYP